MKNLLLLENITEKLGIFYDGFKGYNIYNSYLYNDLGIENNKNIYILYIFKLFQSK